MGYTTYFNGEFKLDKPLFPAHREILESLSKDSPPSSSVQAHILSTPILPNDPDRPDSWCDWIPSEDGTAIVWDEGEKFYNYVEWLDYIIAKYLAPWEYVLNGEVSWEGEDSDDFGIIKVVDNKIYLREGQRIFGDPIPWEK